MKILSWDVGIINLAFCLIEFTDEKNWEILDWDIINLTERNKIKCEECDKNPSLYQEIYKGEKKYYCKIHSRNVNLVPKKFEEITSLEYPPDKDVLSGAICQFVSKKECKNLTLFRFNSCGYCKVHAKSEYKKYENSFKLKPFNKKSVKSMDLDILRLKLIRELDKRKNLLDADIVVIENQPTLKNPRMKAISSTVYDYYLIRGIIDKDITKSKIEKVKYMCPSNKLKLADDGDCQKLVKLKGDEAKTYKLTKSLGIKYCKEMIKNMPQWVEKINSYKKQDDLADAFLQGMYFIINK